MAVKVELSRRWSVVRIKAPEFILQDAEGNVVRDAEGKAMIYYSLEETERQGQIMERIGAFARTDPSV